MFGKQLIKVRESKGLTQKEVAEKSQVAVRTIQRIEAGLVTPRSSTIKLIGKALDFDFFAPSTPPPAERKRRTLLWYFFDLFNLKTNPMKKISILSVAVFMMAYLFINLSANAQASDPFPKENFVVERNDDGSLKRVEVVFAHELTLDSLVHFKKESQDIGITLHYQTMEFDTNQLLVKLSCNIMCDDGIGGGFSTRRLDEYPESHTGFCRDYTLGGKDDILRTGDIRKGK